MKMTQLAGVLGVAAALLFVAAIGSNNADAAFGRTKPVFNIIDAPISTGSGKEPSLVEVERAIRQGAMDKGWVVSKVSDGHMQAELTVRQHFAKVDISYTTKNYSIVYNDSRVLLYDGEEIHRNYNKWVEFMSDRIKQKFADL